MVQTGKSSLLLYLPPLTGTYGGAEVSQLAQELEAHPHYQMPGLEDMGGVGTVLPLLTPSPHRHSHPPTPIQRAPCCLTARLAKDRKDSREPV